jgi:hypothetical protein
LDTSGGVKATQIAKSEPATERPTLGDIDVQQEQAAADPHLIGEGTVITASCASPRACASTARSTATCGRRRGHSILVISEKARCIGKVRPAT